MCYTIIFHEKAEKEYKKLDNAQRIQINKGLEKIERSGMEIGKSLRRELSSCKEIKHRRLDIRVVFTQYDKQINIIDILTIAKGADSKAFKIAAERLKKKQ